MFTVKQVKGAVCQWELWFGGFFWSTESTLMRESDLGSKGVTYLFDTEDQATRVGNAVVANLCLNNPFRDAVVKAAENCFGGSAPTSPDGFVSWLEHQYKQHCEGVRAIHDLALAKKIILNMASAIYGPREKLT